MQCDVKVIEAADVPNQENTKLYIRINPPLSDSPKETDSVTTNPPKWDFTEFNFQFESTKDAALEITLLNGDKTLIDDEIGTATISLSDLQLETDVDKWVDLKSSDGSDAGKVHLVLHAKETKVNDINAILDIFNEDKITVDVPEFDTTGLEKKAYQAKDHEIELKNTTNDNSSFDINIDDIIDGNDSANFDNILNELNSTSNQNDDSISDLRNEVSLNNNEEEQQIEAEPPHEEEQQIEAEPPHEEEQQVEAEPPHEEEQQVEAEQPHEEEQQAEAEQPHEEEQQIEAEQPHEEEQQAEAEQPHEEEQQHEAEPPHEEEQQIEAEPPHEEEQQAETEQPHEEEQQIEAEQPHEEEQQIEAEPPHEEEQQAEAEQPHEEEQQIEAEQPHEEEQQIEAEQPHEEEQQHEAEPLNEEEPPHEEEQQTEISQHSETKITKRVEQHTEIIISKEIQISNKKEQPNEDQPITNEIPHEEEQLNEQGETNEASSQAISQHDHEIEEEEYSNDQEEEENYYLEDYREDDGQSSKPRTRIEKFEQSLKSLLKDLHDFNDQAAEEEKEKIINNVKIEADKLYQSKVLSPVERKETSSKIIVLKLTKNSEELEKLRERMSKPENMSPKKLKREIKNLEREIADIQLQIERITVGNIELENQIFVLENNGA